MARVKYQKSITYLTQVGTTYIGEDACKGTGGFWYVYADGKVVGDITEFTVYPGTRKKYLFMPNTNAYCYLTVSAASLAECKRKIADYFA